MLPAITQRRMERYKKDFFRRNPHISAADYDARQKENEDKTLIIEKRKRFR